MVLKCGFWVTVIINGSVVSWPQEELDRARCERIELVKKVRIHFPPFLHCPIHEVPAPIL